MDTFKLWITLFCFVTFVESEEKADTKCVEYRHQNSPQSMRLNCDRDQMISVIKVIKGVTIVSLENSHNWCNFPVFDPNDCSEREDELTDKYRQYCNTISVCTTYEQYTPLIQCHNTNPDSNTATQEYIHVQYECLPRHIQQQQIPFMPICPQQTTVKTGNSIHIMSTDYPAMMPASSDCLCVLTLPRSKYTILRFMDMDYTTNVETNCPIRVDVPGSVRCAESQTNTYRDVTLYPAEHQLQSDYYTMHINISKDKEVLTTRLWIQVTAIDLNGDPGSEPMRITCYPQPASQPDPIMPNRTNINTSHGNDTGYPHVMGDKDSTDNSSLYGIIGGCVAGLILVIIIIIILVICYKKRRKSQKQHSDLAYMCHANIAAAKRLGAENTAYRNTEKLTSSIIEPYANSGVSFPTESKLNGAAAVHDLYSEIGDNYNRDSKYSDVDSGQYSSLGPSTSKLHSSNYVNTDRASSGISIGASNKEDPVFVVDSVQTNEKTVAQLYAVPLKSNKLPKLPNVPAHVTVGQELYAQPDKAKKAKLTSHTSTSSETQMVENDLYNV